MEALHAVLMNSAPSVVVAAESSPTRGGGGFSNDPVACRVDCAGGLAV